MNKKLLTISSALLFAVGLLSAGAISQNKGAGSISQIKKEKRSAEDDIKATQNEIGANEQKVNESLSALRQIDDDIAVSENEISTVQGQINTIKGNIGTLENNIATEEEDLTSLRGKYLKAVKKMRIARKQSSGMAFLFASGSFNEARRRMRYMKEFSDWRDRRSGEILGKVNMLQARRGELVQAKSDADVALKREVAVKQKLDVQKKDQQATVATLRENGEVLKNKLAKRQADARRLSNQISSLIAEQQAKDAQIEREQKKAAEERRLAEEKAASERKAAEEKRLAAERKAAEERERQAQAASNKPQPTQAASKPQVASKPQQPAQAVLNKPQQPAQIVETPSQPNSGDYAAARARKSRRSGANTSTTSATNANTATATTQTQKPAATTAAKPSQTSTASSESGFGGMKGSLPKPVNGSFKIVSAFGRHPISPDLPDFMEDNHGIDAHVAKGATVSAVYDGEVIKIYDRSTTPGFRNIVVVKHGDYITVYANLETLSVRSGQKVKQGQSLGTVGYDFDDPKHGMIHFEVWKKQTYLNPAAWIKI